MEIKISKCGESCRACEIAFVHEEKIHSVAQTSEEGLERFDFCKNCYADNKSNDVFCAWECQYSDPRVAEAERQETFSPLRRLFYDLAASDERSALAQAFLAAQLLKRQRVFRQIKETEEEQGMMRLCLYLDRVGGRLIETKDLNFSYTELDEARVLLLAELQRLESPESGEVDESSEASEVVQESVEDDKPSAAAEHAGDTDPSDQDDRQEENHV
jgi:hypothetical protein